MVEWMKGHVQRRGSSLPMVAHSRILPVAKFPLPRLSDIVSGACLAVECSQQKSALLAAYAVGAVS